MKTTKRICPKFEVALTRSQLRRTPHYTTAVEQYYIDLMSISILSIQILVFIIIRHGN
jgi:hypothetical protein